MDQEVNKMEDEIAIKLLRFSIYVNTLSIVGNIISHLYYAAIITIIGTILFFIILKIVEANRFKFMTKTKVVLVFYVYFTILWFFNAGSSGSTIILFIVIFFVTYVVVPHSKHIYFTIGSIILITTLYTSEYLYPDIIMQEYPTKFDRFLDVVIISIISLFLMKILIDIIKESYQNEQKLVSIKNVELEQSKKELKESRDFFTKLSENIPGVVYQFEMNEKGKTWFNYINGAVNEIYEVTPEQVYNDQNYLFNMLERKHKIMFTKAIKNSFDNLTTFSNEHKILTPSGKHKYILSIAKPEKLKNGNIVWYGHSKDITIRIEEKQNLIENEAKFRFISENTHDGIVVLEKKGITYTSKSYSKLFGYEIDDQLKKTEQDILNLIHPDDKINLLNEYKKAIINKRNNLTAEYRYLHKNGNYIWREDSFSFIYHENKEINKIIIIARDISEQKKYILELEDLKVKLEQTNIIAKLGRWDVDLKDLKVNFTDTIYSMFEVNQNLFETNIYSVIKFFKERSSRKKIRTFFKNAILKESEYQEELELTSNLGKNKWLKAIGKPVFENGKCVKLYGTLQDITTQKQQELKLKELALVASKTNDAIILTDVNAKILWVNKAFLTMTEYSLEEVVGKEQKDLLAGPNTDWKTVYNMMDSTLKYESINTTLLNYTKSGKPIWFDISVTPVFNDLGVCTNFIDVKKDATERVEKQEQLQHLTKITSEQNERLLNFTYIISHNIRSHSANISGLIQLIEESNDWKEKEAFFEMLKTSTVNLEETIQNLNEIISIQNNSNQNYSVLNLKNEVEKTFGNVIESIKKSEILIENNIPETIAINVIPAYLDSILLNMITNAIKYRSMERKPFLIINATENDAFYIISFEDNGLGLNLKKHKEKLFGMYNTFHKNLNSKGLGLFITKNQIEAMDGKIEVESEENKGSIFKIFFPKFKTDIL